MSTFLSRLRKDQTGNVMMIFAAAIIPMIGLVGGAMDASVAYMTKSRLQKACDAGILAGRQSMNGTQFQNKDKQEAQRFFQFNFPNGLYDAQSVTFDAVQNSDEPTELFGTAEAVIPTSLMVVFGIDTMSLSVECNARKDLGHNDIVLVLDVTGSMDRVPSSGGSEKKIEKLRKGAMGLYRALADSQNSTTRYGIVPYSHTVNVGRSLRNRDILDDQQYVDGYRDGRNRWVFSGFRTVSIKDSTWGESGKKTSGNRNNFRTSGDACIEERPSVGNAASPVTINNTITLADIDSTAANGDDTAFQFGRYDPAVQQGQSQSGCPSEARKLQEYNTEAAYQTAINATTERVTGGTYHDVGLLWGLRFISRNGYFAGQNPTTRGPFPVNQHIIFMTDGVLDTGGTLYSADGVNDFQQRVQGSGNLSARHLSRFASGCDVARAMGVTVWVIAFDVVDVNEEVPECATSEGHYFVSDGSDLEQVFAQIGRGIGNLRLSK